MLEERTPELPKHSWLFISPSFQSEAIAVEEQMLRNKALLKYTVLIMSYTFLLMLLSFNQALIFCFLRFVFIGGVYSGQKERLLNTLNR